eukprot:761508-Hanusia_phi.AAC.3
MKDSDCSGVNSRQRSSEHRVHLYVSSSGMTGGRPAQSSDKGVFFLRFLTRSICLRSGTLGMSGMPAGVAHGSRPLLLLQPVEGLSLFLAPRKASLHEVDLLSLSISTTRSRRKVPLRESLQPVSEGTTAAGASLGLFARHVVAMLVLEEVAEAKVDEVNLQAWGSNGRRGAGLVTLLARSLTPIRKFSGLMSLPTTSAQTPAGRTHRWMMPRAWM